MSTAVLPTESAAPGDWPPLRLSESFQFQLAKSLCDGIRILRVTTDNSVQDLANQPQALDPGELKRGLLELIEDRLSGLDVVSRAAIDLFLEDACARAADRRGANLRAEAQRQREAEEAKRLQQARIAAEREDAERRRWQTFEAEQREYLTWKARQEAGNGGRTPAA
jgi:hypothetical protein